VYNEYDALLGIIADVGVFFVCVITGEESRVWEGFFYVSYFLLINLLLIWGAGKGNQMIILGILYFNAIVKSFKGKLGKHISV